MNEGEKCCGKPGGRHGTRKIRRMAIPLTASDHIKEAKRLIRVELLKLDYDVGNPGDPWEVHGRSEPPTVEDHRAAGKLLQSLNALSELEPVLRSL